MRTALDVMVDRFTDSLGERWFDKTQKIEAREELYRLVRFADTELKMVTGELNGRCYNTTAFADALSEAVEKEVNVHIIFHKDADKKRAIERLQKENRKLVELKKKHSNILHIYWQKIRNPKHFSVIDSDAVYLERPHDPGQDREVVVKYHTTSLGRRAEKEFDRIIGDECVEVMT